MDKTSAVKYLCGLGYDAEEVDGVLVVWTPEPMKPGKKDRLRNALRAIGFRGSWGWRIKNIS